MQRHLISLCVLLACLQSARGQATKKSPNKLELDALLGAFVSPQREERLRAVERAATFDLLPDALIPQLLDFARSEVKQMRQERFRIPHPKPALAAVKGDSEDLKRVQAQPQSYIGKTFLLYGMLEPDDYYNYAYNDAENTHFSLRFQPWNQTGEAGELVHLYLGRKVGVGAVETFLASPQKSAFVRILAGIVRYEGVEAWRFLELLDVQFLTEKGDDWQASLLIGTRLAPPALAKCGPKVGTALYDVITSDVDSDEMKLLAVLALKQSNLNAKRQALPKLLAAQRNPKLQHSRQWITDAIVACTAKQ